MLSQIGLLFWALIGSSVAGMVILSGLDLPPAGAVVRRARRRRSPTDGPSLPGASPGDRAGPPAEAGQGRGRNQVSALIR